jgi:methylaspartate ammonia-lyase
MNNGQALTDMNFKVIVEDPIVLKVLSKYYERSQLGIQKYGRTLDRDDLSLTDWLNHLQEELMDATLYIEKLKADLKQAQKAALIELTNMNKDKG